MVKSDERVNIFSKNIPYKIYISAFAIGIAVMPEILISQSAVPFYFRGTSLLIVVSYVLEIIDEITIINLDSNLYLLTIYVFGIDVILSRITENLLD